MSAIRILIPFGALVLGRRLFIILNHLRRIEKGRGMAIRLRWSFYIEQAVTLACVAALLIALSPVEAIYAIAGMLGVFLDLLISIYYYSVREEKSGLKARE